MIVRAELCWSGGDNYHFRLTLPKKYGSKRIHINSESWSRKIASIALDEIVYLTRVKRSSIRFFVK